MQSRMAPTNHEKMTHQNVVHWFNELMYDIKVFIEAGHPALIVPARWHAWDSRYRPELAKCDEYIDRENRYSKHQHAVEVIDALMADLEATWYKRQPKRGFDAARFEELDSLYNGLQECKTPTKFY